MPVDPATLRGYTPRPSPRPPRPAWVALVIALVGAALLGLLGLIAWGDPALTSAFMAFAIAVSVIAYLTTAVIGWKEGGFVGAVYKMKHPFGTSIGGDPKPSGLTRSLWFLVGLTALIAVLLWIV